MLHHLCWAPLLWRIHLKIAKATFSAETYLSRASVQFSPSYENTESASIFIPASKTDPFCKGVTI
ncbi:hypothetical protein EDD85DRAFT_778061 [Armillaria nabsnona]|nr:hypothetical protein EDD85DRAFT_778061 [Armillaria nabsnona]